VTPLRMKVCGVTSAEEVAVLGALGVDYVGVWHGAGGRAELTLDRCRAMAGCARAAGPEPVIVTFIADPRRVCDIALQADARWLQLHGYQSPTVVRALKLGLGDDVRIIKALHLRGRTCLEERLIAAYERAGVDVFLLDSTAPDGRLGSTGRPLEPRAAGRVIAKLSRPFMLAGGLDAAAARAHAANLGHVGCLGLDVDTGARAADGAIDVVKVRAIRDAWTARRAELVHL
jgi:phosphoribosylanthranilate isomerase